MHSKSFHIIIYIYVYIYILTCYNIVPYELELNTRQKDESTINKEIANANTRNYIM